MSEEVEKGLAVENDTPKSQMIPIQNFAPPQHDMLIDCPSGEVKGVVFYPDERLRIPSAVITEFAPDGTPLPEIDGEPVSIDQLVADMATTMYSVGGIGLSAIQIGVPLRVFICDIFANIHAPDKGGENQSQSQLLVAINPEIGWMSNEKWRVVEGCLSFPGINESVERPSELGLRGFSRKGVPFALRAKGVLGRVILHEMDHLDGVTIIDRVGRMQKKIVSKRMSRFHQMMRTDTIRVSEKRKYRKGELEGKIPSKKKRKKSKRRKRNG